MGKATTKKKVAEKVEAKQKKTLVTPIGTAKYPRLNEPDTKFKPEGEYSVKLLLPPEEAQSLMDEIEARRDSFVEWLTKRGDKPVPKKRADFPFQVDEETGQVSFTFKSKAKRRASKNSKKLVSVPAPKVVDAKGKPVTEVVWGGSKVRVAFSVRGWATPALGVGVSLQIVAVQVIELVSGGDDFEGFGEVEGGFESSGKVEEDVEETPKDTDDGDAGDEGDGDDSEFDL